MSIPPKIAMQVGSQQVTRFEEFRTDADIFHAAGSFSGKFTDTVQGLAPGLPVKLFINGVLEFTGLIDSVERSLDKAGLITTVKARDLMGLLVDSAVEVFADIPAGESLSTLAARLLATVPIISRKAIVVQGGNPVPAAIKVEPGSSIFEVLKSAARARGLLFFGLPDGTFVFGMPLSAGTPQFTISAIKGVSSNYLEGSSSNDISRRYSKVVVMGIEENKHVAATVFDPTFPAGLYKPIVVHSQGDEKTLSASAYGQATIQDSILSGFSLSYKVSGFTATGGQNYRINTMCAVNDNALQVKGRFLVFGRTFMLNKDDGAYTDLKLSKPGAIPQ